MLQTNEIVEHLPRSSLLKNLPRAEAEALLSLGVRRRYEAQEMVVSQGDPGESMMIVLTGSLRASLFAQTGKEILLSYIQPGDVVGVSVPMTAPASTGRWEFTSTASTSRGVMVSSWT